MAFDIRKQNKNKKHLTRNSRLDKIKSKLNKGDTNMQTVQSGKQVSTLVKPTVVDDKPFVCKRRYECNDDQINNLHPYFFELLDMVSVKRRYNTNSELAFRSVYFKELKLSKNKKISFNQLKSPTGDTLAYYYKASDDPILWSSHTDSVHTGSGNVNVAFDPFMNLVYVADTQCPLGADDAAGMWIMFQMIRAGIGGTYMFHIGEEVGGIGSSGVALHHPDFLKKYKAAIAFDRKDVCSVITHQGFDRCCSDDFADSFITCLGLDTLGKDDGGVFTDTANYTGLIGECTNISIGYYDEHTQNESLDAEYLVKLLSALITAFSNGFDGLVFKRKPGEVESSYNKYYGGGWSKFMEKKYNPKSYNKNKRSMAYDYFDSYDDYYDRFNDVPPWEGTYGANELAVVEKKFFDNNCYNLSAVSSAKDAANDPEYARYEEEVEDAIHSLSSLDKTELEAYIVASSENFMASVVRRLLHEAGYV